MPANAAQNRNLNRAKAIRNDEFYTQLSDIERELAHYEKHFSGKTVLCNCDDPRASNFFDYFARNFERLQLKKLITTCYKSQNPEVFSHYDNERAISLEYNGDLNNNRVPDPEEIGINPLQGDGDFRSEECVELLREADVVVTNPPFSLFREYVKQLIDHDKKFVIIGNKNAITYKEVFLLIKSNQIWIGGTSMSVDMLFDVPPHAAEELVAKGKEGSSYRMVDGVVKARASAVWFTNLDHAKRHEDLVLYKKYSPEKYPTYDNYDAIDVGKTNEIPADYPGVMGVPISFLDKYNPGQFEILGSNRGVKQDPNRVYGRGSILNGKEVFKRLFIKHKTTLNCGD